MNTVKNRIEEIKEKGYPLSFEVIFDDATRIYKQVALPAGMAFLFFGILYLVVVSLLAQNSIDMSSLKSNSDFGDIVREIKFQMENQPMQQKITDGIVRIIFGVLMIPMAAGAIGISRDFDTGKDSMRGLFYYFKGHSFSDLFISGLVLNLLTTGIALLAEYFIDFNILFSLFLLLFNVCISVLSVLFIPLIIFGNLGPIEAIRSSFTVASKNFWTILLLILVVSILCMLGFLGCCIGVFFTLPLYCTFIYSLYKHSVGIEENTETNDLS